MANTNATINLRPATPLDAADLAILDNMAGMGLPEAIWRAAVEDREGMNAFEFGRMKMLDTNEPFAWPNAVMAELDGMIAGAATGYAMPHDPQPDGGGDPVKLPLMQLFVAAAATWALDMLAVYAPMRGRGVARALMADAFRRASMSGCDRFSVIAESQNRPALALYEAHGLEIIDRRPLVAWDEKPRSSHWLLLQGPVEPIASA